MIAVTRGASGASVKAGAIGMPGTTAVGLGLGRPWFAAVARAALAALGLAGADLEIRLVDDAAMAALNEEFLGCPGPTNVLAFEAGQGGGADGPAAGHAAGPQEGPENSPEDGQGGGPRGLGQVALSLPTARREALLYGQDEPAHCARLLVHAVLHLAGFDHGEAMEAETERILPLALAAAGEC